MTWLVFYSLIDWVSFYCMQANPEKFQAIAVGKKLIKIHPAFNVGSVNIVDYGSLYRFLVLTTTSQGSKFLKIDLAQFSGQKRFDFRIVRTTLLQHLSRLGMSVTTQGGSGRQDVTGSRRKMSKFRFVLLNVFVFGRIKTQ